MYQSRMWWYGRGKWWIMAAGEKNANMWPGRRMWPSVFPRSQLTVFRDLTNKKHNFSSFCLIEILKSNNMDYITSK